MVEGLKAAGLPEAAIQYVRNTDRAAVGLMLEGLNGAIDLIIPRGGKGLTGRVMREARVPVLAHLEGICHAYIHAKAELAMARKIVLNAKMRRTSICGAAETLLIDRAVLKSMACPFWKIWPRRAAKSAATKRCARFSLPPKPRREEDWKTEYLDAIIAVKVVNGLEEAIAHIEHYGSHHTDSIVTEDASGGGEIPQRARQRHRAVERLDPVRRWRRIRHGRGNRHRHRQAACPRARSGVEQLTTFKYVVRGNGPDPAVMGRRSMTNCANIDGIARTANWIMAPGPAVAERRPAHRTAGRLLQSRP